MDYNERGKRWKQRFFDEDNQPSTNTDERVHEIRYQYDELGRKIHTMFFDAQGQEVVSPTLSYHKSEVEFDRRGNEEVERYYQTANRLLPGPVKKDAESTDDDPEYRFPVTRYEYNAAGVETLRRQLDADGNPLVDPKRGCAAVKTMPDNVGRWREVHCLGGEGELVLRKDGYAYKSRDFNPQGKETRLEYHGAEKELVAGEEGWAIRAQEFHPINTYNSTKIEYFGPDEERISGEDGWAIKKVKYDPQGRNELKVEYWGPDEELVAGEDGWAIRERVYSARGKIEAESYRDEKGDLVAGKDGWARQRTEYDEFGNSRAQWFYGSDGEAIVDEETGCVAVRREHNNRGKVVVEACLGENDEEVIGKNGWARTELSYQRNKVIRQTWKGADGRSRVNNQDGYSIVERVWNDRGKQEEERYFGPDEAPTSHRLGYSLVKWEYNDEGRQTAQLYLDMEGNLVNGPDGWARLTITRASGQKPEKEYVDAHQRPVEVKDEK